MKTSYVVPIACVLICSCFTGCAGYDSGPVSEADVYWHDDDEQLATMSDGQVACPTEDMDINDHGYAIDGVTREWTVDCYGQRYYCASHPIDDVTDQTSCTLAIWPN